MNPSLPDTGQEWPFHAFPDVRKKLRVLDLFSGIGGFSLGLERTGGFETVAFCEIAPYARSILAHHWPNVPIFEDIRNLTVAKLNVAGIYPNVIVGGFPCQDLSTSGSGEGLDGERSGLWWEFARLISEIRPRYVVVENSPELLDRWMGRVLGALAQIGMHVEWHCIPASAVGAPHRRDRVWIIAYAPGERQPRQRQLVKSLDPTPDAYREASGFVHAFHEGAVPFVCGRHDGVSAKLAADELHALGNAVVPAIPELLGQAILSAQHLSPIPYRPEDEQDWRRSILSGISLKEPPHEPNRNSPPLQRSPRQAQGPQGNPTAA